MSISHLKKQAKNLHRLLPGHMASHPDGGPLSACQELIAQTHGYPSFHAANQEKADSSPTKVKARLPSLLEDVYRMEFALVGLAPHDPTRTWLGRGLKFLQGVIPLVAHLEAEGKRLELQFFELSNLEQFVAAGGSYVGSVHEWVDVPLKKYLDSLPGYRSPLLRNGAPLDEGCLHNHLYAYTMAPSFHKHSPQETDDQTAASAETCTQNS